MSGRTVIVGSGIAGLLASAVARDRREPLLLVEPGGPVGGLLSSFTIDGRDLDHGTHVPQETGQPEIDELLFTSMEAPHWRSFARPLAGNVFSGNLNSESAFPDLRTLPPMAYARCLTDLVHRAVDSGAPANERDYAVQKFGRSIADEVIEPIVHKLLGAASEELAPGAHELFLDRVIAATPESTRALKQIAVGDRPLAYHSSDEGASNRRAFYPRAGGCGRWVDDLRSRFVGDDLMCSAIRGIEQRAGSVSALVLADGTTIEVDRLVWTVPVAAFARAVGFEVNGPPPEFRRTELYHLEFDRPFCTEVHYVSIYDPGLASFRVTLYPNLRDDPISGRFVCTVEVMGDAGDAFPDVSVIADELRSVGIADPRARVGWSARTTIANGFPVIRPGTRERAAELTEQLEQLASNVVFAGRGTGRVFFMPDVLRDVYDRVTRATAINAA